MGCQQHSQWACRHIKERNSNCTRLIYHSQDQINGIDLEFLQSGTELSTYLQVHSHPIIPYSQDPSKIQINIRNGNKLSSFLAPFHQGKQRIHLPQALQDELISWLGQDDAITIEIAGYRETITPENFAKVLKNLKKPGLHNPFRLPF